MKKRAQDVRVSPAKSAEAFGEGGSPFHHEGQQAEAGNKRKKPLAIPPLGAINLLSFGAAAFPCPPCGSCGRHSREGGNPETIAKRLAFKCLLTFENAGSPGSKFF